MPKNMRVGKGKRSSNRGHLSFNKQPVPDSMCVTLRYADNDDVTATAGIFNWQFRGNGAQDPDVTFVGVQPPTYDQWAALYQRYTVESSSITVRAISRSVSNCMRIAVAPQNGLASVGGFDAVAGNRYAVSKDTTGGAPAAVLSLDLKTSTVNGVPEDSVLNSAQAGFDSDIGGLPQRQWLWNIAVETSGASDAVSLYVVVHYRIKFWLPVTQAVSLSSSSRTPRQRRHESLTHRGVTATAVPEKPTELFEPRGGSRVTDPVIHPACPCGTCEHMRFKNES